MTKSVHKSVPGRAAAFSPFLTTLTVRHGPAELLGRFLLAANTAFEEQGLQLELVSAEQLLAVNEANADSWLPLARTFDHRYSRLEADASFCLAGRDATGRIMATNAARRFDWHETTFAREMTSLRLLYAHPERDQADGEGFTVTPGLGDNVRGVVGWMGAAWYHPSVRRRGLPAVLSRIARAYAFTRWGTDYSVGMSSEQVQARGYARQTGYHNMGWAIEARNSPLGPTRLGLGWLDTSELIADIETFMAQRGSEREGRQDSVVQRATQ